MAVAVVAQHAQPQRWAFARSGARFVMRRGNTIRGQGGRTVLIFGDVPGISSLIRREVKIRRELGPLLMNYGRAR